MTAYGVGTLEAVLSRIDSLADRGSLVMRTAAFVSWAGAVAATLAVFSVGGKAGWLLGVVCLLPGLILWRYGRKLAAALDVDCIRSQIGDIAGSARNRLGEIADGIQTTRRSPLRGGLSVLKSARAVRRDLAGFGVDVTGIAEIANPGVIALAVASLFATLILWLIAAAGVLARVVL